MLKRLFGETPAPLTGAPTVRRLKTYSSRTGYVYQYYYLGQRAASREGKPGNEFVFDVSADRKTYHPVAVFVSNESIACWEAERARALISAERYAIAKMALLQAFDERAKPSDMHAEIRVRPADIRSILETLGVD